MGLDISFCKMPYNEYKKQSIKSFDDISYVNFCGWRLKDLAEGISSLAVRKNDEYEYVIKVSELSFFKTLWDRVKDNLLLMILRAVEKIDGDLLAYETYESFPPIVKASLALVFNAEEFLDKEDTKLAEKSFIVHTFWELFEEDMDLYLIEELARVYQKMIEDKQDYVYFYISF